MEDSFKKLCFLIEECLEDTNTYKCKNRLNFINGYINSKDIEAVYKLKENKGNYNCGKDFDFSIFDTINREIKIEKNDLTINENYLYLPIETVSNKLDNIEKMINSFNDSINRSYKYIQDVKSNNINKIGYDYIFTIKTLLEFSSLLLDKITERLYQKYDFKYLNFVISNIYEINDEKKLVEFLVYIYNNQYYEDNNINRENSSVTLLNNKTTNSYLSIDIIKDIDQRRNFKNKTYYCNFDKDRVLKNFNNLKVIDESNYKKYIKLRCNANLLDNVEMNIQKLFEKYIKKEDEYLVSSGAYFLAIQDLKIYRGKKYCWICGEKLGVFSSEVTCKKHRGDEASL